MIELYGAGPSRWAKPYWMLKEIGKEFKECTVDFRSGEHKGPKITGMNPYGKLPVMKDDSVVVYESTAIMNYIGEKYPESGMVPKSGTAERALYDQWMSFCTTELEQPLWRITKHTRILPDGKRIAQDVALAKEEFDAMCKILDSQIGNKKFVVGNKLTGADITLAYTLGWAQGMDMVTPHKNCMRYLKEMQARPAFPGKLFQQ